MLQNHGKGTTTSLRNGEKQVFRTVYSDGTEKVEEYSITSQKLVTRRWKSKSVLGRVSQWEYEIGGPSTSASSGQNSSLLSQSSRNPVFECSDDRKEWIFRVKNITYPEHVYDLQVDEKVDMIVLRTSNKKYYKRFSIPSLIRHNIRLDNKLLSFSHEGVTLTIGYRKPKEILDIERKERKERESQLTKNDRDGDVECKTQ